MEPAEIHSIADWLCQARQQVASVTGCPGADALQSENDGYAVQEKLHKALTRAGLGPLVGYKLGCTTTVMQQRLGIATPAYGGIMAANLHRDRVAFASSRFQQLAVECEIAVWIGRDLLPDDAPFDRKKLLDHIAACSVAMELVDNRYGDPGTTPAGLLIADDFFQASCIVGPRVKSWMDLDLARATGSTRVNEELVGTGTGADVMGHPLEALAWLANRLAERDCALQNGHVVLTGAIVAPYWIKSFPAEISVEVDKLGRLSVSVA